MQDVNANGRVDRVQATFSETLAASTDTAPWTLTNVPSGGTLASVSTSGATATLVIAEGAGAQNTAVGTFRVVLAASATGIRDAAVDQSRRRSAPVDQATPTLVSASLQDTNANGKVDRVLAIFSETLAAYRPQRPPGRSPTSPPAARSPPSRSPPRSPRSSSPKAPAPDTAAGGFTVALATNATGIRDAAGNLSPFAPTAPATPPSPCRSPSRR